MLRGRGCRRPRIRTSAEHDAEHREAGAGQEGGLEALGEGFGSAPGPPPRPSVVLVREFATVASTAEPERAADLLRGVDQAAGEAGLALLDARHRGDRDGTNEKPSPTAASSDGPSTSLA